MTDKRQLTDDEQDVLDRANDHSAEVGAHSIWRDDGLEGKIFGGAVAFHELIVLLQVTDPTFAGRLAHAIEVRLKGFPVTANDGSFAVGRDSILHDIVSSLKSL